MSRRTLDFVSPVRLCSGALFLLPQVMPGFSSELLSRRPNIRYTETQLSATNANVAVARAAALFPSIQLTGSAGGQSNTLLSLFNGPNMLINMRADLVHRSLTPAV